MNRLQGGVSNRLEVDQAKANRAVTASAIPDIERQIAIAENALSVLLGRPPGTITRGTSPADQILPPKIPAGLPAQLLERRPDVVQAEQLLVAANANVGVAKALFYPTISLTGSLGAVSSSLSDFLTPESLVLVPRRRPLPADLQRRADQTELRSRPSPGTTSRWRSIRRPP